MLLLFGTLPTQIKPRRMLRIYFHWCSERCTLKGWPNALLHMFSLSGRRSFFLYVSFQTKRRKDTFSMGWRSPNKVHHDEAPAQAHTSSVPNKNWKHGRLRVFKDQKYLVHRNLVCANLMHLAIQLIRDKLVKSDFAHKNLYTKSPMMSVIGFLHNNPYMHYAL